MIALAIASIAMNYLFRLNPTGVFERQGGPAELGPSILLRSADLVFYFFHEPWFSFDRSPVNLAYQSYSPSSPQALASILGFGLATFLAWKYRSRFKFLAAAWLFHICAVVPMLGVTEATYYPADRYSYLSSLVWVVALALELASRWEQASKKRARMLASIVGAVLLVVFAASSVVQARAWQNSIALFTHILDGLDPDDPYRLDIYWRLASAYLDERNPQRALEVIDKIFTVRNDHAMAYAVRGSAWLQLGELEKAIADLEVAAKIPATGAQRNLARAWAQSGNLDRARDVLKDARKHRQDDRETWLGLAEAFRRAGRVADAQEAESLAGLATK
jgi:tetratricopeptide (TPR) repeat protein